MSSPRDSGSTSTASPARTARSDCGYRPGSDSRNWSPGIPTGASEACAAWTLGLPRTGRRSRSSRRRRSGTGSLTRRAARSRAWSSAPVSPRKVRTGPSSTRSSPPACGRTPKAPRSCPGPRARTESTSTAQTVGLDWKIDGIDLEKIADRVVTIHARRKVPVEGRLVLPSGMGAEGLLITGFGFGPRNQGDRPVRPRRADGSFTLRVAPEHGYVLGIVDLEWAADPWSGLIVGKAMAKPAGSRCRSIRGARDGPRRPGGRAAPGRRGLGGHREQGRCGVGRCRRQEANGRAGIGSWLRTDEDGVARAGAARGKYEVRMASGDWDEERTIVVSSDRPVEVVFHRPGRADDRSPAD